MFTSGKLAFVLPHLPVYGIPTGMGIDRCKNPFGCVEQPKAVCALQRLLRGPNFIGITIVPWSNCSPNWNITMVVQFLLSDGPENLVVLILPVLYGQALHFTGFLVSEVLARCCRASSAGQVLPTNLHFACGVDVRFW